MPDRFVADDFTLDVVRHETHNDVTTTHVKVRDRFTAKRHSVHRAAVRLFLRQLERHLRARPHLTFDHPRNIVPRLVYLPPAVRSWAAYMPGAFATQPVHNPDTARLQDGTKLDYITKNLFRHSVDATGLRSRAYAMAWYVRHTAPATHTLRWLSLASGTGRQTLDAASLLRKRAHLTLTDIDSEALAVAAKLAHDYERTVRSVVTVLLDATDKQAVRKIMSKTTPDVIDAMGLFEYLSDEQAVELIRTVITAAQPKACFVFSNMRPTHPELQLHKRGVGWPGVIVRETDQVVALLQRAGVTGKSIDIVLPDDNVYAVYCISAA